jgi:phosphatidyl-myo-inositol alpha-mannosyltransferase
MKILQVSPFDFNVRGGVNEHVNHLDAAFRTLGMETRILAAASADMGENDDGHIYRLGRSIPFPSNGSTARVTVSPFVISKVSRFLERENFDVIHVHEPLAPVLPMAALLFSKALNVATFHAARDFNFWYHYIKAIMDLFVDRVDCRVAVSEVARESIDSHFPGDYQIVPNGIDLDRFRPDVTPITEYLDGMRNILFVGRYDEPRKGFNYLLRAMPSIQSQFPNTRLIVVGRGDVRRAMRQVEERAIPNVVFVGAAKAADLPRYYATCDVYCAPSTGRESFGIVLLEALATGAPVVASNIPGYAGVIEHGVTGILAAPANSQDLALRIVRVLADDGLRRELRENGLREVQRYGWHVVARQLLEVYDRGLAQELPVRDTGMIPEAILERARG